MATPDTTDVTTLHYVTKPFNRCIYCGSTENLSKEHAIPHGLLGRIVLPAASCGRCRAITHAFETHCQDHIFHAAFRERIGIPKRRGRKRRSDHATYILREGGEEVRLVLPTDQTPRLLSIPVLTLPKIISGNPTDDFGVVWHRADMRDMEAMKQHGAERVRRSFSVDAFILMLAKIGHCIACATLSAEDLATYRLLVPDYLHRRETDVLHIVGGVGVPPGHTDLMHEVEVYTFERPDRELRCAKVRLFAFIGAPEHLVVVGERPLGLPAPKGA